MITQLGRPTRVWNYDVRAGDGNMVRVSGALMPGGRIDVRFSADGAQVVAADAGDYIYPSDVRLSAESDRLYVRAQGITAAFGHAESLDQRCGTLDRLPEVQSSYGPSGRLRHGSGDVRESVRA
jgi:hypothetical protein